MALAALVVVGDFAALLLLLMLDEPGEQLFVFGIESVATDVGGAHVGINDASLTQGPEVAGAAADLDQTVLGDESGEHAFGVPQIAEFGSAATDDPDEAA